MTQYNYPYYNYRTYPQTYNPYVAVESQGQGGYSDTQQMGQMEQMGQMGQMGQQMGQMGQMGQPGQMGQMGQMGTPFTQQPVPFPTQSGGAMPGTGQQVSGMLPAEQSYIENILRLNKGKLATIYMTFENNREWNAKIFKGIIEAAGRDHIIISDPQTNMRYLLPMVYLDYITFDEEIEYEYPFGAGAGLATYPPR